MEVMSADAIVEEMKVDGIATESNEKIKHFTNKRQAWKAPTMSQTVSLSQKQSVQCMKYLYR